MKRKCTSTSSTFARHRKCPRRQQSQTTTWASMSINHRTKRRIRTQRLHDMSRLHGWMSWRVRSSDLAFTRVFRVISDHPPAIPDSRVRETSDVWCKFTSCDDLLWSGSRLCWSLTTRQVWSCAFRRVLSFGSGTGLVQFSSTKSICVGRLLSCCVRSWCDLSTRNQKMDVLDALTDYSLNLISPRLTKNIELRIVDSLVFFFMILLHYIDLPSHSAILIWRHRERMARSSSWRPCSTSNWNQTARLSYLRMQITS